MANKQLKKWMPEEEDALKAGVAKYGEGKWKKILKDDEFSVALRNRSNVDLKDKWRNLVCSGSGIDICEITETYKRKRKETAGTSAAPLPVDDPMGILSQCRLKGRSTPKRDNINDLIIEAVASSSDARGVDLHSIVTYIEQWYDVPEHFRRYLYENVKELVFLGELEKVGYCYKIKDAAAVVAEIENLDLADPSALDLAAKRVAYGLAKAEIKLSQAAEAVQEAERISEMCALSMELLDLLKQVLEQCSMGNTVRMP